MPMTQREMIKMLKKYGGKEILGGGKGSHAKVKMPNNQMVIIPKGELKKGTERQIFKQAGLK